MRESLVTWMMMLAAAAADDDDDDDEWNGDVDDNENENV
jgi:hypothetical protein